MGDQHVAPIPPCLTSRLQGFTILRSAIASHLAMQEPELRGTRDFITIGQAAELIGVSPTTLRNWDRSGKLRAVRNPMNRYRLYRREDIEALLEGIEKKTERKGRR